MNLILGELGIFCCLCVFPKNHGISKLVVWRTLRKTHPNPSISKGPMILRALNLEMTIQVFGL